MAIIQNYFYLIKPGIVIGNMMSSLGGFLMASQNHIDYIILINMLIGISLVIASSCVLNNIIDRDIDAIMHRTRTRILAQSNSPITIKSSIYYAIILNILGFLFLGFTKNLLTIILTILGFCIYINVYSLYMKRQSIYSIIVGSISGSIPPIIGYCTVTHTLDIGSLILFIIFIFWQIPHSYSITIFRSQDYQKASIPTFTIYKGIKLTRIHMMICILGFSLFIILLKTQEYISYIFLIIITIMNLFWLYTGWYEYQTTNNYYKWSKKMFFLSIFIITSFNILLILDSVVFTQYK